ncbi:aminoacyltransferase [Bifidobacterium sp. 82T10]|uniref:Aminoacyltransferase n=1 Tax=Bifidobacterium miconis TaxID=2834435 RepID=A0ABS6WDQ3_9BIFI|nr:aminoacyltransferase [Bifidobacterium miconis]MBW3092184.1 aminoacyltransferase [Bifidobacterium miconis]
MRLQTDNDMVGKRWRSRALTDDEFDALSAASPEGGFQQTAAMRRMVEQEGAAQTELVGLVDADDKPIAGAMVAYTQGRFGLEGSIWLGPLCDAHNEHLLTAMTMALHVAAHKRGAISVSCWPDDVYLRRTSDGEPDGEPDDLLVGNYEKLGWHHAGFDRGYGSIVNRWVYVKDLSGFKSADDLLKSYSKNTRRNVKIARNSAVHVRRLDRDELGVFHHICELSSVKQHFQNRDLAYFEGVWDAFGDRAEFMVAEIHLDEYLAGWQDKYAKFAREADRLEAALPESKYPDDVRKKLDTARRNVESAEHRIADAKERIERDGHVVPAAAGLFMWHERELVYFSSGSDERYAKFYAPTAIQHEMMSRCLERGLHRYNFYGISGVFDDPDDPGRGVLEFKQGFNGYVEELPGEFTLPVDRIRYGLKAAAAAVLHH